MTFGDQLAALILELAKNWAAKLGLDLDQEAVLVLQLSSYVDDILGGGSPEQVTRYTGKRLEDGTYTGTLPQILAKVGMHPKVLVRSGEEDPDVLKNYGDKVLGHVWRPGKDQLIFTLKVNLSIKNRKGEKVEPDLTEMDIPRLPNMMFTKRRLLGFVIEQYDPTGIMSPVLIKLKIELRKLFGKE